MDSCTSSSSLFRFNDQERHWFGSRSLFSPSETLYTTPQTELEMFAESAIVSMLFALKLPNLLMQD